jgi:hypothetical protein
MRGDHHSLPVLPFIGTWVEHIGVQQLWNINMSLSVFRHGQWNYIIPKLLQMSQ